MSINEMFNTAETTETNTSARSLQGTAQLTSIANEQSTQIIKELEANLDAHRELFTASRTDHNAMDKLIAQLASLDALNIDFLKELSEETLDGMLKSQQSKRSRAKSKVMTVDNYRSMMSGAVAENLIRLATGKVKSAGGSRRMAGSVEFTAEQLESLKENQEQLKKELRNVQSKKSIMKTKADFSEESDQWQALLVAEAQLKELRVSTGNVRTIEVAVDVTKDKLTELIGDLDINHMKASDSKSLLEQVKRLLAASN